MTRIRELREARGLQQKDLSVDLNVSQPTISDWETGRKQPSSKSAAKISDYFGVSLDYLLCRTDSPAPTNVKKSVQGENTLDGLTIGDYEIDILNITRRYSDEEKQEFLKYAKRFDDARKWRRQNQGSE